MALAPANSLGVHVNNVLILRTTAGASPQSKLFVFLESQIRAWRKMTFPTSGMGRLR